MDTNTIAAVAAWLLGAILLVGVVSHSLAMARKGGRENIRGVISKAAVEHDPTPAEEKRLQAQREDLEALLKVIKEDDR